MPVERREGVTGRSGRIREILARALEGERLEEGDIVRLFEADGPDIALVAGAADELRRQVVGDAVTYVVNRNINYTNICLYKCGFRSEEHTSELQSLMRSSYAVFCLKKKNTRN